MIFRRSLRKTRHKGCAYFVNVEVGDFIAVPDQKVDTEDPTFNHLESAQVLIDRPLTRLDSEVLDFWPPYLKLVSRLPYWVLPNLF